jgi:uncharacterized membrane protein YkvA (DUF1232 family)
MDGAEFNMIASWKKIVNGLKKETLALYYASRDPRVPWYAKAWTILVVAYALSPLDLIPDFIPILGYLDDLVLIPLGISLALKMVPADVLAECRARAAMDVNINLPLTRVITAVIVVIWIALALWLAWYGYNWLAVRLALAKRQIIATLC